ncbi:hypothetical protein CLAFUW4_06993 [Fulvia fulva]|uniref:Wings apart-like protein C-terminal domain-containing protein n=1 Tax=Passalora fulva TaxID=5499 RepID=A0A9Q8LJ60_PASFU|nr:uncharacterized protein CLAFUR5_07129 [Fulvia fulva]KAK4621285.1 hypothetical protein CLAFUR4_07002 [Fulvia fulva]KAK4623441.1 hypothetical protein CLAFUR0_07000 [Fulvia fulva]UJO18469.1 hypothetical protein CLAFUR5_07129 [Fulvia fulva]WPV16267.1 hypothetical protein CLAFUW4_06993 [Fulvia fulva]WPV31577.1 hypothetical protein CLAFUW7_06993 [Fulvia fulva]
MATVSPLPSARRRKPATYGKASRNTNAWNVDSFGGLSEDETPVKKSATSRTTTVTESWPVRKQGSAPPTPEPAKQRAKKQDAFDVPSSDDEAETYVMRLSPPEHLVKRKLISAAPEQEAELAPWEKRKEQATGQDDASTTRRRKIDQASPDAQLQAEIAKALQQEEEKRAKDVDLPARLKHTIPKDAAPGPGRVSSPIAQGAAAKLQAKKLLNSGEVAPQLAVESYKRPGNDTGDSSNIPRKRLRPTEPDAPTNEDTDMAEIDPTPSCETSITRKPGQIVFDLLDSSEDEAARARPSPISSSAIKRKDRRGKLVAYARSSPHKMTSAPARLSNMLPPDSETSGTSSSRSPSVATSRPTTPKKATSSSKASTPDTMMKASGSMTPKQVRLWTNLLSNENAAPSPSALPMEDLRLHTVRAKKTTTPITSTRTLTKSSSDVGHRRTRLVDLLKASAPSSENESSDEKDEDTSTDDVDMADSGADEPDDEPVAASQQSQSQSQGANKITYARVRSYLPEDSLEASLMLDLPAQSPDKAALSRRPTERSNRQSQKSEFDMDESDDEAAAGRLRTVHELRATGTNQRFMDDTAGLLDDISNHQASARSRRRSAMVELARKLFEKHFTEKFVRQSFERQLLAECDAAPDLVTDFALSAAFVAIMINEPPDHVVETMKSAGLLSWLGRFLAMRTNIQKATRDRQNNMSRSAQATYTDFVSTIATSDAIWGGHQPSTLSPRTLALKAHDQLVRLLRRTGDRSELISVDDIRALLPNDQEIEVLPDANALAEVVVAVSTLESLSTTALALAWPSDILERIRTLLVSAQLGPDSAQHVHFLTLRLCLNLTNDNVRNCKSLSKQPTVRCLLRTIDEGFPRLDAASSEEQRTIDLDLLVLSMGVLINLTEHSESARRHAATGDVSPLLAALVDVFLHGQKVLLEAETVEQSVNNVAYGYLAVVLANFCTNKEAKAIISAKLPHGRLDALVDALTEFVAHHQKVDTLNFEGEEGMSVWSAFTEKLKAVLLKLKAEADA